MDMRKEVEFMLGTDISDEQYEEAPDMAKGKQKYIFSRDPRPVVMSDWYLAILTKEYVISLAFSKYTMELSKNRLNMEKSTAEETAALH